MTKITKPLKPKRGNFSSGPCAKIPHWQTSMLNASLLGISHRSKDGLEQINKVISLIREILEIPQEHVIGIIPASTTGAMECAMWNLLGHQGLDVVTTDVFSKMWLQEIKTQLKIKDVREYSFNYRACCLENGYPNDGSRDIVFVKNGTTSGLSIPHLEWINDDRTGITICDASSSAFTSNMPWDKLDATAFSWQKGLGGEAGQGILVLSPRAVERINQYSPSWAIPRTYNLKKDGLFNKSIFEGYTINTPSMLAVNDFLNALEWAKQLGGINGLMEKIEENYNTVKNALEKSPYFKFLVPDETWRSKMTSCLTFKDNSSFKTEEEKWHMIRKISNFLESEAGIHDIKGHPSSELANIRIWNGATIDKQDLQAAISWVDYAFMSLNQ